MFTFIRNLFTSIATTTIVNLAAQVTRLEHDLIAEEDFCNSVLERSQSYFHMLTKANEQLELTNGALVATQLQLDYTRDELKLADASYRSLLGDYCSQRQQLDLLARENEMLKQRLGDANEACQSSREDNFRLQSTYDELKSAYESLVSRTSSYRQGYLEAVKRNKP